MSTHCIRPPLTHRPCCTSRYCFWCDCARCRYLKAERDRRDRLAAKMDDVLTKLAEQKLAGVGK